MPVAHAPLPRRLIRRLARPLRNRLKPLAQASPRPIRSIDAQDQLAPDAVDVTALLQQLSIEELAKSAEDYYRWNLDGADYYFAKPFWSTSEVTDMVITFGQVLGALELSAGMKVLDFGAGTGWTSRYLSQLGCEVVVSDVSATALDLARQLYARFPLVGDRRPPTFSPFDGHRIDLADASVDRILCFDALHHIPNPEQILGEMGRVLRPGGKAAFSEPGPNHSKTAQAQYEMKNYTVIENDIRIRDIERWTRAAGFTDLRLAVFTTQPFHLSIDGYERLLAGRSEGHDYLAHHAAFLESRRVFVLQREGTERRDSRARDGLAGTITVDLDRHALDPGRPVTGTFEVRNIGANHWLASSAPLGPVLIGVHLYDDSGALVDRDFARIPVGGPDGVAPGATVTGPFELTAPGAGRYLIEFDLVAEAIAWFESNGTVPARLSLEVRPQPGERSPPTGRSR